MNNQIISTGGGQSLPLHKDILDAINNWQAYLYVREKYGKFLEELPTYEEGSGITPRIFWWCWLQGIDNAPLLSKRCFESLQKHYPDYEINLVSMENIPKLVEFPEHIIDKVIAGKISLTHFSDLLRLELLINYGGIWADSTVFATGREPYYLNYPLFIFQGIWRNQPSHLGSNWFIVSEKKIRF